MDVTGKGRGVSGALMQKTFRLVFVRKRRPDRVVVGTTSYGFTGMEGDAFVFRNGDGSW